MHSSSWFTAMRLVLFFFLFCKFWEIDMLNSNVDTCNYSPACICETEKNRKKRNIVWGGEDLHTYPKAYLLCINALKVHILSQLRWQLLLYSLCAIILPVTSGNTCALTIKLLGCGFISQFLLKVLKLTCTFLPLHFFFTMLQRAVVTQDWKGKKRRKK